MLIIFYLTPLKLCFDNHSPNVKSEYPYPKTFQTFDYVIIQLEVLNIFPILNSDQLSYNIWVTDNLPLP